MITHLMRLVRDQEAIIKKEAGIIDELFTLLCRYMTEEDLNSIEPLLTSIKDLSERT